MKAAKNLFVLGTILWASAVSATDSSEGPPDFIITTESFVFPSQEQVTEAPKESGHVVLGEEAKTEPAPESKEEQQQPVVEPQPVLVAFPQNHKNFTPSQYLGDQEFPPYYNHINQYQQQYKNYNQQKQLFSKKPIKFEDNSVKNYYLPQGVDPLNVEEETQKEDFRVNRKPFPYVFENENGNWHGSGHVLVHEEPTEYVNRGHQQPNSEYINNEYVNHGQQLPSSKYVTRGHQEPNNEYVTRGHQETVLPQYIFPYSYPQEQKFYKHELVHHDYHGYHEHDVKKDEKVGSPWKKVFNLLTALVPLGLFLATLTPNVIAINSTATTKTSRQRSEESSSVRFREDILELLAKHGVQSLTEAQCEDKIICELARKGDKSTANPIEKGFWYLANETPWDVAEKAGMNDLFKAIKTGNCDLYECHSQRKRDTKDGFVKKLIRKRKNEN